MEFNGPPLTIGSMNQDADAAILEIVQLELFMSTVDLIGDGFEMAMMKAVDLFGGSLFFNVRLDNDPLFQRCAAVALGDGANQIIALVFLDREGQSATVERALISQHPLAKIALAEARLT